MTHTADNIIRNMKVKIGVFLVVLLVLCSNVRTENRCSRRYITEPDSHLPVLSVDCAHLSLEKFPSDGNFEDDLFFLDLSHNEISDLDTPFDSKSLSVLILSYNSIEVLEDQFFMYAPNLTHLDLSHNKITIFENADVFYGLDHLSYLDLSYNGFIQLPDKLFAPLANLQTLNLSYNNLTQQLITLEALSDLNFATALTTLEMNKVGFQDPSNSFFDHYNNLKHLSLADNDFQEIPIVPYSVEYLDLSGSRITTLAARNFNYHSLKTLILNRSWKLEKIDRYAFYNLQSLETLSLDDCPKLKEFNDEVFGVITKDMGLALKRFTLARTGVQSLNYTFTYLFDELEFVDLGENPWKCDCGLFWLRIFNKTIYRNENVRCASPPRMQGRQLLALQDSQLPRCRPQTVHRLQKVVLPILGILIVILISLIIYLIYMAPLIYGNRFRTGPQSPYQGISVRADE